MKNIIPLSLSSKTLLVIMSLIGITTFTAIEGFAQTTNTHLGMYAGNAGFQNTNIGYKAANVVTGNNNSIVGHEASTNLTSGSANTVMGSYAGRSMTNAYYNTIIGYFAGSNLNNGYSNTYLGYLSGYSNVSGDGNVFIGYRAGYSEIGSDKLYIDNSGTSDPLIYGDFSKNAVGINTSSIDGYTLSVNGKVRATEVQVYTGWADYVFEDDYKLNTLEEVESYIEENGHLPDVPDADEVEADGIPLGEMNATLLRKIEELTLYTIAQEKQIKLREAQAKAQEAQIRAQQELAEKQNEINEKLLAKLDELQKKIEALSEKQ